jgi:uncharacterized protein YggT (Ycf19 family)
MIFRVIAKILYSVLLIIETIISIRFVFMLVGANENNPFVSLVYDVSSIFVDPFQNIFDVNWSLGRFYIDVDAIVALVIYMLAAFIAIEINKVFSTTKKE